MKHESKRSVTVEDLLHLKRAERPPAEFWATFERDLRAKQLAALVERRPWWRTMPRVFAGFSRYHLPLGATAVLALTVFSIRGFQPASPERPINDAQRAPVTLVAATEVSAPAAEPVRETVSAPVAAVAQPASPAAAEVAAAPETVRVLPVVALLDENAARNLTPSARLIAANLSVPPAATPRFLNSAQGFESRALPARQPAVEPLSQMAPSDARRSRQFAMPMPVAFNTYTARSEKIAPRLSDEKLYETVRRFGASPSQLNMKF